MHDTYLCVSVNITRCGPDLEDSGSPWFATFVNQQGDVIDVNGYVSKGSALPTEGCQLILTLDTCVTKTA